MSRYPALFIVSSLHKTIWFRVENGKSLEILFEYEQEKGSYSDHEGSFQSSGKGATKSACEGDSINHERENSQRIFIKKVVSKSKELLSENRYNYFIFSAPQRIRNWLCKEMCDMARGIQTKCLSGNYTNTPTKELEEIFQNSLKAY